MAPLYKKALVIGASSGIGEAFALKLAATGTHVIATGRRKDRLEALTAKAAKEALPGTIIALEFDITELDKIAGWASGITTQHPDLDCVVLNSGIQRAFDFGAAPASVDLAALGTELTTNYLAQVHIVTAFLPHLQRVSQAGPGDSAAYLVFVSATLGIVPSLVRTPNYNASKAALHSFITVLRQQQLDAGFDKLRVVEVFPPAVQTELHDSKHQPDLMNGGQIGMPLAAFTDAMFAQLAADPKTFVGIGHVEALIAEGGLEDQRQKMFEQQQAQVKKALGSFVKQVRGQQMRDPDGRRITGPQSALTNYLASRNISARQIEIDYQSRLRAHQDELTRLARENGTADPQLASLAIRNQQALDLAGESQTPSLAGAGLPTEAAGETGETAPIMATEAAATATATVTVSASSGPGRGKKALSAADQKALDKIKKAKKGKGKKRKAAGSDDEEDDPDEDPLVALFKTAAAPMPGQIENCGQCGKRFTVTPYSRANAEGSLLCSTCSKALDREDEQTKQGAKKKQRQRQQQSQQQAVGRRRQKQSELLDGTSPVGVRPLMALCVEHLSRNIHLADELGDLPEKVVDRIARMLSKRRLLTAQTMRLFVRPEAQEICLYDASAISSGDFMTMMQEMPRLKRLVLYNAIQFKDEVMAYLIQRDTIELEAFSLNGANLVSDKMWKQYLVEKGRHLRTLHICHVDNHVTDELMGYLVECAPQLERLKMKSNQQVTGAGVARLGQLGHLQHLNLQLLQPVHPDVFVGLLQRIGGSLQTLSLRHTQNGVDNSVLMALHQSCRQLRKLRITDCNRCTDAGFVSLFGGVGGAKVAEATAEAATPAAEPWANVPLHFVDLEKARFEDPDAPRENTDQLGLCSNGFRALMAHSGSELQHLNISSCRHISQAAFEEVFGPDRTYPELRRVVANFCENMTDYVVRSIFRSCPNAKEVVVFGCMRVTGVGVPHGRILVGVPNAVGMQMVGHDEEEE